MATASTLDSLPPVVSTVPGKFDSIDHLLTKKELQQRLNVPHVRIIDEMTRKRKIPCVRLGHRTLRYSWPKVQAALERLTTKEVGA